MMKRKLCELHQYYKQTIDADGNPENGITISDKFDGSKLSPDLLKMNEAEFTASLAEKLNINEESVVKFDKAKEHSAIPAKLLLQIV